MSSNSIRIGGALFEDAQSLGAVVSRSAAQQVEYWARLGQALERAGLKSVDAMALLQAPANELRIEVVAVEGKMHEVVSEAELVEFKRERQAADIRAVAEGRATNDQMSWFSGGRARAKKLIDSPY